MDTRKASCSRSASTHLHRGAFFGHLKPASPRASIITPISFTIIIHVLIVPYRIVPVLSYTCSRDHTGYSVSALSVSRTGFLMHITFVAICLCNRFQDSILFFIKRQIRAKIFIPAS
ncbi:hypothetical protein GGI35DRAFT_171594 [Trichoderma velutinum]